MHTPMLAFDTLKYANTLKAAGIASDHAEAQAVALSNVLEVNLEKLVTKDYLDDRIDRFEKDVNERFNLFEKDVNERFNRFDKDINGRLIQLEQRMTIKLGGMMVLAIGIVATVVKVLSIAPVTH